MKPLVVAVGTTHPLGFAGLPLALVTIAAQGMRPACIVAGVSAQSVAHVLAREPVGPATIAAQFASLDGLAPAAFTVGALLSAESVIAVARGLARFPDAPVIVDPVLAASGGGELADAATRAALVERLLPRATLVTPNLPEAEALSGVVCGDDLQAAAAAGRALLARGAGAVLIKGGHRGDDVSDVLVDGGATHVLRGARIAGAMRGTGDYLAVRIACALACGAPLHEAIARAREAVCEAIAGAEPFAGTRVLA